MRITNQQKKHLFDIFSETGLNKFDFETSGDHSLFKVKYKFEYYSFMIQMQKLDVFSVTIFPVDNTNGYSFAAKWQDTVDRFKVWIHGIAKEVSTPSGWETFESQNFLNEGYYDLEEKFNESEKHIVKEGLKYLITKIQELDISSENLKIIERKLDVLNSNVDELSKFDWKSQFIGTIASLIMTLIIPPEFSGAIWEYIENAFLGLKLKS